MGGKLESNISKEILKKLEYAKTLSRINPEQAYEICTEAYNMATDNELLLEQGYALNGLSYIYRVKSDVTSCIKYSYRALEIFERVDDKLGKVDALNLIGIAYFYSAMYEQALNYWLQALDVLEGLKEPNLESCILNNVGEVFKEFGKFEEAIGYYSKALEHAYKNNAKRNIASILNNIGEVYFIQDKFKEAIAYYFKSYDGLILENDMVTLGEVENNIGKVHLINSNYIEAEKFISTSINRLEKVNNKFYIIGSYMNMGKLEAIKGHSNYFFYFEKAIISAKQSRAEKKLGLVYQTIAEFCEQKGDYKCSLEYFKKYHAIDQSIINSAAGNRLEILKIEFQHIKEKEQLKKFKIINQRLETEIFNQRNELEYVQKVNKTLEEKVNIDELTGVANRRYINNLLQQGFEESLKTGEIITIFMIDIDHFKKYNDYWGHAKGDESLRLVANAFKQVQLDRNTEFARYGGEEFIYYAKGLEYEQALELADQLKTEIEKLGLKYTEELDSTVLSISLGGVVARAKHFTKVLDMLEIADRELYKVKNSGRNGTSLAGYIFE